MTWKPLDAIMRRASMLTLTDLDSFVKEGNLSFVVANWETMQLSESTVLDLIEDGARNANSTFFCNFLQPGRNINAVTVNVVAINNDITEIDANAEL